MGEVFVSYFVTQLPQMAGLIEQFLIERLCKKVVVNSCHLKNWNEKLVQVEVAIEPITTTPKLLHIRELCYQLIMDC